MRRFVKDIISLGSYRTGPSKQTTLEVTPDRLNKWATRFNAARAAGVDFEVTVDHSQKADGVIGYLDRVFVEGGKLMGVHEFADDKAVELAQRVKNVSVEIHPDYVDGKGNGYGEMIIKSSLVQRPVVPGQSPFVAMSENQDDQHLWLSSEIPKEEPIMDFVALSEAAGEPVNAENILAVVKKLKAAAKHEEPAPTPAMLSLQAENQKLRRSTVVTGIASLAGKIPAALIPKLQDAMAGTDAQPSVLCMSVAGQTETPASAVIAVLSELPPLAEVKERSGGQAGDGNSTEKDSFQKLVESSINRMSGTS